MPRILYVVLIAAGMAVAGASAAQSEAPIARPDIKAGERWKYRRIDYASGKSVALIELEVTFANERVIQLIQKSSRKEEETDVTFTAEWNQVSSGNAGVFNPHNGMLRFPLRAGDSWNSRYDVKFPRHGDFEVRHQRAVKAIGWEDVEVPAGRFRALKVVSAGTFQRLDVPRSGTVEEIVWYVPEVKRFVKWTFENAGMRGRIEWWGFELLEYKLK